MVTCSVEELKSHPWYRHHMEADAIDPTDTLVAVKGEEDLDDVQPRPGSEKGKRPAGEGVSKAAGRRTLSIPRRTKDRRTEDAPRDRDLQETSESDSDSRPPPAKRGRATHRTPRGGEQEHREDDSESVSEQQGPHHKPPAEPRRATSRRARSKGATKKAPSSSPVSQPADACSQCVERGVQCHPQVRGGACQPCRTRKSKCDNATKGVRSKSVTSSRAVSKSRPSEDRSADAGRPATPSVADERAPTPAKRKRSAIRTASRQRKGKEEAAAADDIPECGEYDCEAEAISY